MKLKLNDSFITMVTITGVNGINYGLNLVLGRWLGPQGFAEANILATLVLVLSFIGITIQMSVTNEVAHAETDNDKLAVYKTLYINIIKTSLIFSFFGVVFSISIGDYLNLSSPIPIFIIMVGIPFYFALSAKRGYYQGLQNFKKFSMTFVIESFSRLAFTVIGIYILLKYNNGLVIYAVAGGFLISFIASCLYESHLSIFGKSNKLYKLNSKRIIQFLFAISIYELSQILINNFDVILVKHYFGNYEAGIYASVALIGRIVYFGTWTIVTLLFPKVIAKEKNGESHIALFYSSLAIVFGCGVFVIIISLYQGEFIMNLLFGAQYVFASHLLWKYALATTIFATANVFVYYYMSLKKYFPIFVSLLSGVLQIGSIILFHSNLNQVINIQIWVMTSLLACMFLFHLIQSNNFLKLNIKTNVQFLFIKR